MAGLKISELPIATTLQPDNLFVVVQAGVTKQIQSSLIKQANSIVIITDVTSQDGIVGLKTYLPNTVPPNVVLNSCTSDSVNVQVHVMASGTNNSYSPTILVNGVNISLTETSTKRWFSGVINMTLNPGVNTITAVNEEGSSDISYITLAGAAPSVIGVTFGSYPGTQTELKLGDIVPVNITTELSATSVIIHSGDASNVQVELPVVDGVATGNVTISGLTGNLPISIHAKNSMGSSGDVFVSSLLPLNQTAPTISAITIGYPAGKEAFGAGDVGTFSSTISNFDTVSYTSSSFTITDPDTYGVSKSITNFTTGYVATGTNILITATRSANGATTSLQGLAKIATTVPTASISIVGSHTRLVGSPTGIAYEVRITPSQLLSAAPSLDASLGVLGGSWTYLSGYWKNTLTIFDSTTKGTGIFSNLSLLSLSDITGTAITSGSTYVVGGFSTRTLTFPAFSRVTAIGTNVSDQTKTNAQLNGGNILTRYTDNLVHQNGYYIANSNGTYNPTGNYIGLSDSAFAGSNTTGTLQIIVGELE